MFRAGTCFLAHSDSHLWIILSDPLKNADQILYVNLTTFDHEASQHDARNDRACQLAVGEHSFIRHATCVYFYGAQVGSLHHLQQRLEQNKLRLLESASPVLLSKIRACAGDSLHMEPGHYQILIDQNLVD